MFRRHGEGEEMCYEWKKQQWDQWPIQLPCCRKQHLFEDPSFTWPLGVMTLQSCHALDIEWSPPKGHFKKWCWLGFELWIREVTTGGQRRLCVFGVWLLSSLSQSLCCSMCLKLLVFDGQDQTSYFSAVMNWVAHKWQQLISCPKCVNVMTTKTKGWGQFAAY